MPDCWEVKCRKAIQTIALAHGIGAGRAVLGYTDYDPGDEFFDMIVADGPLLQIKLAKRISLNRDKPRNIEIEIPCNLWFGYPNRENYDGTAIENVLFPLMDVFTLNSSWTTVTPPTDLSQLDPEEFSRLNPIVGKYQMYFKFVSAPDGE